MRAWSLGQSSTTAAVAVTRKFIRELAIGDQRAVRQRAAHLDEALKIVRAYAVARYPESVDIAIRLNVDAKRSDERVRGSVVLPHGTGKTTRVAVFAQGELADEARAAGAEVVGGEELVQEVLKGRLDFDRVLATPDLVPSLARAARALGPKGLMPNPKRGTVTTAIAEAVQLAKGGEVQFRAQKAGIVHSTIGRIDFSDEALRNNAITILDAVLALRPQRFRSKPPSSIALSSTLGPAVRLDHRLW